MIKERIADGFRALAGLLKEAVHGWMRHDAPRTAAALAFYGVLSLAPTATVGLALAGFLLPDGAARQTFVAETAERVGPRAAQAVDWLVEQDVGAGSGLLGLMTLVFGATVGFAQLQSALNDAWEVEPDADRRILRFLQRRGLSFVMTIFVAAFLVTLTFLSAVLDFAMIELEQRGVPTWGWLSGADFFIGLLLTALMIAVIYQVLPDAEITLSQVLFGAGVTAVLLSIGRYGVSAYLSWVAVGDGGNVGGALLALMFWVYASALIFLFGAELTRAYAEKMADEPLKPSAGARRRDAGRSDGSA